MGPASCSDPAHSDLLKRVARVEALHAEEGAALRARIAELEARLDRRSRNSSRPPSSDPPWETRPPRGKRGSRKPGAQSGHKGKTRPLIPPEDVDRFVTHGVECCPACGGTDLEQIGLFRHQVTEIPPTRPHVTEHQVASVRCRGCGTDSAGELPADVARSQFGPRLHALTAHLCGGFRLTHREITRVLDEVFGVHLAVGSVTAMQRRVSLALEAPYREAQRALREGPAAYIDETSWRERRRKAWLWVAHYGGLAVYHIDRRRNRAASRRLFAGKFHGVRIVDRFVVHDHVEDRRRQLCNAHGLRDFEGFATGPPGRRQFGRRGRAIVRRIFRLWHRFQAGRIDRPTLAARCEQLRLRMIALLDGAATHAIARVRRFAKHLRKHVDCLFTFATVPGIEPTSNPAERMLRPAVLWRKGSFGSHSAEGSRFVSRMLTVSRSLRLQQRDVLAFVVEALDARAAGRAPPSLLPTAN